MLKALEDAANLVQTPTCPRCNGEMIKRVAKKGARQGQTFYGCRQFPRCRGIVNISTP
ncbi:topoisomerase DNA-binding C4 zinc finger domain-containing protein [Psychrobacter sp. 1176_08]|uniref:topoisomerase DNA-binding C4 zinc finger domain-containing protein n=1 Tax=Psychrobacter sp. 1176_08 TaxID=2604452 RepID=UPI004062959A